MELGSDRQEPPVAESTAVPSPRAILVADAAFDVLVGAALIASTISWAARTLGAGSLKPWPLFVVGAGCLVVAILLLAASTGPDAAVVCRLIWRPNMLTTVAGVALLLAFPHLAHPYVVGLAVASIGCAVFATPPKNSRKTPARGRRYPVASCERRDHDQRWTSSSRRPADTPPVRHRAYNDSPASTRLAASRASAARSGITYRVEPAIRYP